MRHYLLIFVIVLKLSATYGQHTTVDQPIGSNEAKHLIYKATQEFRQKLSLKKVTYYQRSIWGLRKKLLRETYIFEDGRVDSIYSNEWRGFKYSGTKYRYDELERLVGLTEITSFDRSAPSQYSVRYDTLNRVVENWLDERPYETIRYIDTTDRILSVSTSYDTIVFIYNDRDLPYAYFDGSDTTLVYLYDTLGNIIEERTSLTVRLNQYNSENRLSASCVNYLTRREKKRTESCVYCYDTLGRTREVTCHGVPNYHYHYVKYDYLENGLVSVREEHVMRGIFRRRLLYEFEYEYYE